MKKKVRKEKGRIYKGFQSKMGTKQYSQGKARRAGGGGTGSTRLPARSTRKKDRGARGSEFYA